jgi:cell division cycle 2-like
MDEVFRAPEILLGEKTYSTAVDMWSVGCIFGELLLKEPIFQAKNEMELISMIFKLLGAPTPALWPGYSQLPLAKSLSLPVPHPPQLQRRFPYMTPAGIDLLSRMLTYDPDERISAVEALQHPYFRYSLDSAFLFPSLSNSRCSESPPPKHPDLFGSFPSVAAGEKYVHSPFCTIFALIYYQDLERNRTVHLLLSVLLVINC